MHVNYSDVLILKVGLTSEMNITGTLPPLLLMAKSRSQILRDTSPRHACLGEVSRETASRQSRELIMRASERRTYNVVADVSPKGE